MIKGVDVFGQYQLGLKSFKIIEDTIVITESTSMTYSVWLDKLKALVMLVTNNR